MRAAFYQLAFLILHAVESSRGASVITAAFVSRDYENLRGVFVDYLHQPYRKKLVPFLDRVIRAGEQAGALGGFLSGSGQPSFALRSRARKKSPQPCDALLA